MSDKDKFKGGDYKYGFVTELDTETIAKGLNEQVIRLISEKKGEPPFMLDFRLKAFAKWKSMQEPAWQNVHYEPIDYQQISYYSAPKQQPKLNSLDEVSPEVLETFAKLGIPLEEQKRLSNVAVDAVFDSVSVATTHQKTLYDAGVIFCSISEALREFPELVARYMGSVVPVGDNYFGALNSAVFTDGSFVYIPPYVQ